MLTTILCPAWCITGVPMALSQMLPICAVHINTLPHSIIVLSMAANYNSSVLSTSSFDRDEMVHKVQNMYSLTQYMQFADPFY